MKSFTKTFWWLTAPILLTHFTFVVPLWSWPQAWGARSSKETRSSEPVSVTTKFDKKGSGTRNGRVPGRVSTSVKTVGGVTVICGNLKDAFGKVIHPQTCGALESAAATPSPSPSVSVSPTPSGSASPSPSPSAPPTSGDSDWDNVASAISPDSKTIYYGRRTKDEIFIYDIASKTKKKMTIGKQLRNIYTSPDGKRVIFDDCEFVSVMDAATLSVKRIDFPLLPWEIEMAKGKPRYCDDPTNPKGMQIGYRRFFFSPDNRYAVIGTYAIDLRTLEIFRMGVGHLGIDSRWPVFSPDSSTLYGFTLGTGAFGLASFDFKTRQKTDLRFTWSTPPPPLFSGDTIALDESGSKLYAASFWGGAIVMDLKSKTAKPLDLAQYPEFQNGLTNGKKHIVSFFPLPSGKIVLGAALFMGSVGHLNVISIDSRTDSVVVHNKPRGNNLDTDCRPYSLLSSDGTKALNYISQERFYRLDDLTVHNAWDFAPPEVKDFDREWKDGKFVRRSIANLVSPDGKTFHILYSDDSYRSYPLP